MTITPSGLPAWQRANDFTVYGGHADKHDYQNVPSINPKTDVSAAAMCRLAADVAAVHRTATFAAIYAVPADPAHPTVSYVRMMPGICVTPYTGNTPPAGFPTVEYVSTGVYTVTFASSYTDPFGVSGAIDLQFCHVSALEYDTLSALSPSAARVNAYTWTIYIYNTSTGNPWTSDAIHMEFA
jgi:hypothetical protein